jgi:hypothetical protein
VEKSSTATLTTIPTEVNGASGEYSTRHLQPIMKKLQFALFIDLEDSYLQQKMLVEDDNRKFRSFSCAELLDYLLHYGKHDTPIPIYGKPLYPLDPYFHKFQRWEFNDTNIEVTDMHTNEE